MAETPGVVSSSPSGPVTDVIEPAGQLAPEQRPERVETGAVARLQLAAAGGVEDLEGQVNERGVLFGDERTEP